MKFRFLADPLFLFCLVLYFINRLVFKPYLPNTISQNYLNDLILIPFWVPIMLFGLRCVRLRDDKPPRLHEVIVPLLMWSVLFEVILPNTQFFKNLSFADPWDVVCYVIGALLSVVYWRFWYVSKPVTEQAILPGANGVTTR